MEDINRSGPTEERREELRLLMKKLKESGKLGTTGMMSDMNEGGALEGSRSQTVVAPPAPPAPVPPSPPPPVPPSPPPITAEAVEAAVQPTDAADAPAVPSDELLEDGLPKSSGSVGGRWVPPEDPKKLESLKPKISTWGVFERPADISKAYGGGKRIGVGGAEEDPDEKARRQAEIDAKLKSYRESLGGDFEAEKEHTPEIEAARKESAQLSRMGDVKGALAVLVAVEPWLCDGTELGGRTLLELGWAYDAAGDRGMGKKTMGRLRKNQNKEIRRMSQQLAFQDEAADFLGVKAFGTDGPSEFEKLSRLPRVKGIKRYNLADAYLSSSKRPPVDSLSEARMTLRSAAVRRSDNGAPQRLRQSIKFMQSGNTTEPLLPKGGVAGTAELLCGSWNLALTAKAGKITCAPPRP